MFCQVQFVKLYMQLLWLIFIIYIKEIISLLLHYQTNKLKKLKQKDFPFLDPHGIEFETEHKMNFLITYGWIK